MESKQPWYQRGWGIGLIVMLAVTAALGITGALDEDSGIPVAAETTTTAPPTTQAPPTTLAPTTTQPPVVTTQPAYDPYGLSNLSEQEWLLVAGVVVDSPDIGAGLCSDFQTRFLHDMAEEFKYGWNSEADAQGVPLITFTDATVMIGMYFSLDCSDSIDMFYDELDTYYYDYEIVVVEELFQAIYDSLEAGDSA